MEVLDRVVSLLKTGGDQDYIGEAVTQLEHALQVARAAHLRGGDSVLVVAALLHDVGHLLGLEAEAGGEAKGRMLAADGGFLGIDGHERIGAEFLRSVGFGQEVYELVLGHTQAKRYLVTTDPDYARRVSPASMGTLVYQGGVMTPEEVAAFEADPLAADKIRMRLSDEEGKMPGWQVPELDSYIPLIRSHLEAVDANGGFARGPSGAAGAKRMLLFTPGPLTTSASVKAAMQEDAGSRDSAFVALVRDIRRRLVQVAGVEEPDYSAVLMQGSGTFGIEAVVGSALPAAGEGGRLLVAVNGAYGRRLAEIAERLGISTVRLDLPEHLPVSVEAFEAELAKAEAAGAPFSHAAFVHCETTSGVLNDAVALGAAAGAHGASVIVDAMSAFGAIPLDVGACRADFVVSSANKCLQGVPGFSFVVARRAALEACKGRGRSLSLDLHAQWAGLESASGQFRFTPPTHALLAFHRALLEFEAEGGVAGRGARYQKNREILREGMAKLGFHEFLAPEHQSCIITSYKFPDDARFDFERFYGALAAKGYYIYPGKVSAADCFRVGTIGDLCPKDFNGLIAAVAEVWPTKSGAAAAGGGAADTADAHARTVFKEGLLRGAPGGGGSNVQAVVFDWAGTTIDYGSRAPLLAFLEVFRRRGVEISEEEARRPMGLTKIEHIRELLQNPETAAQLQGATVEELYQEFLQVQAATINDFTDLIPGVASTVTALQARGIKIGSTTGYSRFMIPGLVEAAKKQGYAPQAIVAADEVPAGRPSPFMAWAALTVLNVQQPWAAVKVGDTVADIGEGLNAGMWTVGLSVCGNEVGLSEAQLAALAPEERKRVVAKAEAKLRAAGAHYVIGSAAELPAVVDHVSMRLARGERP